MEIVDYRTCIISDTKRGTRRYAARYFLASGGCTSMYRLNDAYGRPIAATASCLNDEPHEIQMAVRRACLRKYDELLKSDELIAYNRKFQTVSAAAQAYTQWFKLNRRGRGYHALSGFVSKYGGQKPHTITRAVALEYAENLIEKGYARSVVKNYLTAAGALFSWMEKQGAWQTRNPFHRIFSEVEGRFKTQQIEQPNVITDEMFAALMKFHSKRQKLFFALAHYTGLRPSEVCAIDLSELDTQRKTLVVHVSKTKSQPYSRIIAVPDALIEYISSTDFTGKPFGKHYLLYLNPSISELGITAKTFRKDFARRMEESGASLDVINLHQGRVSSAVIEKHYLRNKYRAATICRPYLERMFGAGDTLVLVKPNSLK